jgi:tRNA(adenine34) deaminase
MDFMMEALAEARKAFDEGELPVGCVIVKDGAVIARGRNCRESMCDPTGHAEIAAIRAAAEHLGDWRLTGCDMYVTLEPCPMCAGAISQARVSRLFFGAYDPAQGCAGSVYRIPEDPAFGHFCRSEGGIMEEECRGLLEEFFRGARGR